MFLLCLIKGKVFAWDTKGLQQVPRLAIPLHRFTLCWVCVWNQNPGMDIWLSSIERTRLLWRSDPPLLQTLWGSQLQQQVTHSTSSKWAQIKPLNLSLKPLKPCVLKKIMYQGGKDVWRPDWHLVSVILLPKRNWETSTTFAAVSLKVKRNSFAATLSLSALKIESIDLYITCED